jgi:hypothetical protein
MVLFICENKKKWSNGSVKEFLNPDLKNKFDIYDFIIYFILVKYDLYKGVKWVLKNLSRGSWNE